MLFQWGAPDSAPGVRLAVTGSDELPDGSAGVAVEVGVNAKASSVCVSDGTPAKTGDGEAGGPAGGVCDQESTAVFAESLEGRGEGESDSTWGSGPGPADQLVGLDLVVCAGVGSCGSVQTTGPSATYHTSLCRLSSFSGLSARRKTLKLRNSSNLSPVAVFP